MPDRTARGIEAHRILESEVTQEALSKLDAFYVNAWRNGKTLEAREDAFRYLTLLEKFKMDLRSAVTTGELEMQRQKELEGRKPFWKLTA